MPETTVRLGPNSQARITGLDAVTDLFTAVTAAAKAVGKLRARIQTDVPYAHWINAGFYRSGRPGRRRAGGAHMLEAGLERIRELAPRALVRNLEKGPAATAHALSGVLGEATKTVKAQTPARSGNLRASFHTVGLEG